MGTVFESFHEILDLAIGMYNGQEGMHVLLNIVS